jgi:hypothetical protein
MDSKNNPHKPNTQEWKDYEKMVIAEQQWRDKDTYREAKAVADKRIKTLTDQVKAQNEKKLWVDDILEFLDGDAPEYDEVLDGPKVDEVPSTYWRSVDPLNWKGVAQSVSIDDIMKRLIQDDHRRAYASFVPIQVNNVVLVGGIPDWYTMPEAEAAAEKLKYKVLEAEHYQRGFVEIPIRKKINWVNAVLFSDDILSTTSPNDTFGILRFQIRRIT